MNTRIITIDIETLPAPDAPPDTLPDTPPDTTSPASSARANSASEVAAARRNTGLDGDEGRLLCIGFCDEENEARRKPVRGVLGWDHAASEFTGDERRTLADFWELMLGFRPCVDRIVGHNIFNFDLLFIYKRSIICGVRPTVELSFRRYANQPIYDTMCEWERWNLRNKPVSLDRLARLLGLESPKSDAVNGSRVAALYAAGEHTLIRDYCLRDVETTRRVFRRMTFAPDPPACTPRLSRRAPLAPVSRTSETAPSVTEANFAGAYASGC